MNPVAASGRQLTTLAVVLAAALHGGLLLTGSYARTYDAWIHIFFADHYARSWWDTWEPRWYTGFTMTSYPPGGHQAVALLTRVVGLQGGFVIVQLAAVLLLVVGVYRFSRIWVDGPAAGFAAILAAISTSVAETVHVFGQLPTTLSLALLLNGLPFAHRWVYSGGALNLISAVILAAATTGVHHVTTLFGSLIFAGPVLARAFIDRSREPLAGQWEGHPETVTRTNVLGLLLRRLHRIAPAVVRAGVYAGAVLAVLVLVVLPYWLWSRSDPITQVPIPHSSRENYLKDLNAGLVFWLIPWGLLLFVAPLALWRGRRGRTWPLAVSVALLALIGTGGTTPLPRLILGSAFDILTLDRFTLWATIAVLPLAGVVLADVSRRPGRAIRISVAVFGILMLLAAVLTADLTRLRTMQPAMVATGPIVEFIQKDEHWRWRYLALGFGDQMAWLSAQTTAQTVDGNYHSARRLPELVSTPVERLDGAKFRGVAGIGSLQQFLAVPEKYHLGFVFSNDEFYDPLLFYSGWERVGRLDNGVVVWRRQDIAPLPHVLPSKAIPVWQERMWGTLPITSLVLALLLLAWTACDRRAARRVDRALRPLKLSARPAARHWGRVEAMLDRVAARASSDREAAPSRRRRRHLGGPRQGLRPFAQGLAARCGLVALSGLIAIGAVVWFARRPPAGPDKVLQGYYLSLDVKRFAAAWGSLDPRTRPTFARFLVARSRAGGLEPSFSKLDTIRTVTVSRQRDIAVVRATARYVTSLSARTVVRTHRLVRQGEHWRLEPSDGDVSQPADELVRRPSLALLGQGRRLSARAMTAPSDVLDRPVLRILSARAVRSEGRLAIVGEVENADDAPGDLTVTGQMLGSKGQPFAQWNASTRMIHTLRPGEVTPFRIDPQGIAGAIDRYDPAAGEFDPDAFTPLRMGGRLGGIDVYAKAVVTASAALSRTVGTRELRARVMLGGGVRLTGVLENTGAGTAGVPHVLVVLYDRSGKVAWVDDTYVMAGILAEHRRPFAITLPSARSLTSLSVPLRSFVNGLQKAGHRPQPSLDIPLAPSSGYSGLRVVVQSFDRDGVG